MLFDSLSFFIFFPLVTILYYVFPHKARLLLLLVASCFFYMAFIPSYIFILAFLICIDYVLGILIEKETGLKRKYFFVISILSNIGTLFVYKYFNFFNANLVSLADFLHWNYSLNALNLALPIGLSFHTFQSLSYIIEIYKKRQKAERNFGIYALYVMFYPQLVAGPIERPGQLLPQLHSKHRFDEAQVKEGLYRMLFGLFKKVVIADRLALLVNLIYGTPTQYIGLPLIFATIAFAIQIYCDFSGYTDIAIGAAQVMGFKLVENFNYPYLAKSIQDFWRRWHMSLYSWFRDYVYIPLGGNRVSPMRHCLNILIVFSLTGLWHGANWTYIIWGFIHGVYLIINVVINKYLFIFQSKKNGILAFTQTIFTFTLVCFAWIFFRANSLSDAFYIITHSTKGIGNFIHSIFTGNYYNAQVYLFHQGGGLGLDTTQIMIVLISLSFLIFIEYLERNKFLSVMPVWLRWGILLVLVFMVINLQAKNKEPFIYFQF